MAKQTPEQEALDQQRVYDNAMAVEQMKARRNADAYQQLQRQTEQAQGRYQADPILQQYLESNPDVFRAATDAAIQSGVPKQGSRFSGGISNEYQNILDDFARQHYIDFGRKEGRGIASLPTVGRGKLDRSVLNFTPKEYTMQNYGYVPNSFDAEYYAASNPDVRQALGTSPFDLYQHFIDYGKAEGRQARNPLAPQQFAEGGQVMGGMQPMTPASENSGIASGMMPEPPPPEGMQAMQQMAGQMEQVYRGLDSAEDIEDVINAMRGDDLPLSERYSELAELVGPADAKKTPESVLTVLQPVFQTLETVPDGGIAEAPMGGVEGSEGNFSQPSATEPSDQAEAVLAMSRGEMPVKAASGFYAGDMNFMGANNPYITSNAARDRTASVLNTTNPNMVIPTPTNTTYDDNLFLGGLSAPELESSQISNIQTLAPQISALYNPTITSPGETDPKKLFESRKDLLSELLPRTRTPEQILEARQKFMGDIDKDDSEMQGYLALAKAGSAIAGSTDGLLGAITDSAGTFAADLSKIASQKSKRLREGRGAAFDVAEAENLKREKALLDVATKAIADAGDSEKALAATKNLVDQKAESVGLSGAVSLESERAKNKNLSTMEAFKVASKRAGEEPAIYFKKNKDGTIGFLDVYRTGKTPFYFDRTSGEKIDGFPPRDYLQLTKQTEDLLTPTGLNLKKATKTSFVLFNQKTGQPRQIEGLFDKNSGLYGYVTGGKFKILDPARDVFVQGKIGDTVKFTGDPTGNQYIETRLPDGNVKQTLYKVQGVNALTGNAFQVSTDPNSPSAPYSVSIEQEDLGGGLDPEVGPPVRNVKGNAFLRKQDPSGITKQMLPKEDIVKLRNNVENTVAALNGVQEFTSQFNLGNITGVSGSLKTIFSKNLAQFLTDDMVESIKKAWDGGKSAQGEAILRVNERLQQAAFILNSRFATTEQQFLRDTIIISPQEFFTDPKAALIKMTENARYLNNRLFSARHLLDPENNPMVRLDPIPTGSESNPFEFYDTKVDKKDAFRQYDFLNSLAKRGVDLSNQNLRISRFNAKKIGLAPQVWSRKDRNDDASMKQDFIIVPLKTENGKIESQKIKKGRGQGGR